LKPIQIDRELADPPVQLRNQSLAVLRCLMAAFEKFRQPLAPDAFPLPDQKRMPLVLPRNLRRRFDPINASKPIKSRNDFVALLAFALASRVIVAAMEVMHRARGLEWRWRGSA
jgi:hypothetical protein